MNRRIPERTVTQIAQSTDLVALIGERVDLVQRGQRYLGLCPFHPEKSPSFTVNPEWRIYKCFGCGRSGGAYQFLMELDALSFPEAVAELARRAGIALDGMPTTDGLDALRDAVAWAAGHFRGQLLGPAGSRARQYLAERGFRDDILERFGVGYAPPGFDVLLRAGQRAGIAPEVLERAGLLKRKDREGSEHRYDLFRDRVIFPIADLRGRPIAFGGRILPGGSEPRDREAPKYINSPESPLYKKSATLYGYSQGREDIRRTGRVLVAEGYTDVILAHQYGAGYVVACCGTSLTEEHAQLLARVARDQVLVVFDGDGAGVAAAERGLEILLPMGRKLGVVELPGGADPADLLLAEGVEAFTRCVDAARDPFDFKLEQLARRHDMANAAAKARAIDELLALLARVPNPVERELRSGDLARSLGLDPRTLAERRRHRGAVAERSAPAEKRPVAGLPPEAFLLEVLCHRPDLAPQVLGRYPLGRFRSDPVHRLASRMYPVIEAGEQPGLSGLLALFEEPADAALLVAAAERTLAPAELDRPLADFLDRADKRDRDQRITELRRTLLDAELARDATRIQQITHELNQELRALRGVPQP